MPRRRADRGARAPRQRALAARGGQGRLPPHGRVPAVAAARRPPSRDRTWSCSPGPTTEAPVAAPAEPGYEVSYDPHGSIAPRSTASSARSPTGRPGSPAGWPTQRWTPRWSPPSTPGPSRSPTHASSPTARRSPGMADVFVSPAHRGRGLGRRVVEAALRHPPCPRTRPSAPGSCARPTRTSSTGASASRGASRTTS